MPETSTLSHVDPKGGVRMVDVSKKPDSVRTAVATGKVLLGDEAYRRVQEKAVQKGDVLTVAQIAGIMSAKETSRLIPLCHDVQIDGVDVEFAFNDEEQAIEIRAYTKSLGVTGVEMEALTAVSITALTIYDMCKSISKGIRITDIHLLAKTGGQSGNYRKPDDDAGQ